MSEMEVRIEQLPPMRVAYVSATGQTPEKDSLDALLAWARQQGLSGDAEPYRLFGYDNCLPHPDHVYTAWLTVGPSVESEGEVRVKAFSGGLYAVTSIKAIDDIGEGWKRLEAWRESSRYQRGSQQCLEELLSPVDAPPDEFCLDLYLSLAE